MTEKVDMLKLLGNISDSGFEKVMVGTTKCADPLFKVTDIAEAENDLAKLVRYWFVVNGIGQSKFNELHRKYSQEHGIRSSAADRDRGNMRKSLLKERITWDFLVSHLMPVLGLTLDHVVVSFVDTKTGELVNISSLDANEKVSAEFPETKEQGKKLKEILIKARDAHNNQVLLRNPEKEK